MRERMPCADCGRRLLNIKNELCFDCTVKLAGVLSRHVLEWQTEAERNHGRAENLHQDLVLALQERDAYVDKYREAAGLPPMEHPVLPRSHAAISAVANQALFGGM